MDTSHADGVRGPRPDSPPAVARAAGAAVTGALLAYGACQAFVATARHRERACTTADGTCVTWWDVVAVPVIVTAVLVVLSVVYGRLSIGPRIAVVPVTVLLAALVLPAAWAAGGWWAAAAAGGVWSGALALAAVSRRHRPVCLCLTATLLLACLFRLYH
ncbi:hypothetical protein ACLMNJ_16845 [Streptomyces seoulensis]